MSDATPNLPKGHNAPKMVTQDMLRKDAQAQADAGTKLMGTLDAAKMQMQEMNQMERLDGVNVQEDMED